ncbi:MAG: ATP-binding cassette domain-containing protein, partial [Rhodospirillaceae bacterium]
PIVANVSFSIPAGASLGIVGPSGSGKTTLLRILAGLAPPTLGEARLDGADLTRWCSIPAEQGGLGAYLGYLPQSIQLVAGTVGENIARFGDTPSSEAVIAAAQMADVHDMILRLPQGYDTLVGDGGLALSGGQQQRVGLARALYGTPRLVLLDEPNAHLDPEGERALVKSLDALAHQGTTVVMVTHRAALLAHVQLVAVMRDRTVLEFGPRDSVMAKLREAAGMAAAGAAGAGATGAGAGAQSGRVARSSPNAMEAVR